MDSRDSRRGWTIIETAICILVFGLALLLYIGLILPSIGGPHGSGARLIRDSNQVRGIIQGMITFAQNNKDRYPLPSVLDAENATVSALGTAKDTSANIMSILVYQGFAPVEMFVSPAEVNPNIRVMETYEFDHPKAAVDPAKALWDSAFSADFTSPRGGNLSYAHVIPAEPKPFAWANTFTATAVVLGNRGPEVRSVTKNPDGTVTPVYANPRSNTFRFHGSPTKWEGMIGYNDNHVNYELSVSPEGLTYNTADGRAWPDHPFFDEPDDKDGTNAFLGIFITAGPTRRDFTAIWD